MRLSPITYYNTSFTSVFRKVYEPDTKQNYGVQQLKHRNNTFFYRNDIQWNRLMSFLDEKYRNVPKVNTYCYACSDGSEPYSLIIDLFSNFGDQAKKFLPIIAKDYDEDIIKCAKSGKIFIPSHEMDEIRKHTKGKTNKFLNLNDCNIYFVDNGLCGNNYGNLKGNYYGVKSKLSDNVIFSTANILEDVKSIIPDNSIVMCRNFWPYMKTKDNVKKLAESLYNQLGNNSILILGSFDEEAPLDVYQELLNAGFSYADRHTRVFEKD